MSLAGYMKILNQSDSPVTITSVSSPDFNTSMIHETVIEDGLARMRHQGSLEIAAGESVLLEPNGYHLMLMQPGRTLEEGDTVEISLEQENGEEISVIAQVRGMTP